MPDATPGVVIQEDKAIGPSSSDEVQKPDHSLIREEYEARFRALLRRNVYAVAIASDVVAPHLQELADATAGVQGAQHKSADVWSAFRHSRWHSRRLK